MTLSATEFGKRHRELMARKSRERSLKSREIAPLPPIRNPQRRIQSRKDLRYFCEHYLNHKIYPQWKGMLVALIKNLMATNWWVEGDTDGDEMVHLSKIMIDSGYVPEVVDNAIRLVNSPIVVPSKGSGVKATNKPMRQWHKNKGRR